MGKIKDITGRVFGKLTVIGATDKRHNGNIIWKCRCSCGEFAYVRGVSLSSGHTKSCGCLLKENKPYAHLEGKRFGKLVAIAPTGQRKRKNIVWKCICDCGNECFHSSKLLQGGDAKSCGCLRGEQHGESNSKLYRRWKNMIRRCNDPDNREFHNYGGRGISVCEAWLRSYSIFRAWAVSHGYAANLQMDRIDNDGNYSPENCRWVTPKENSRNKRNSVLLTIDGVTQSLPYWCERYNIGPMTVKGRLKRGMSHKEAVTLPIKTGTYPRTTPITVDGTTKTLAEWCVENDIAITTVRYRLLSGWSEKEAIFHPIHVEYRRNT